MNRWIAMLTVACCVGACGGEAVESPEPQVATPTMEVRSAVPVRGIAPPLASVSIHAAGRDDLCVDAGVKKGIIHLWRCKGTANQVWTFAYQPDGSVRLIGVGGSCLGGAATGEQLRLTQCNDMATLRLFRAVDGPSGTRLRDVQSAKCLTVHNLENGGQVYVGTCDPNDQGQLWNERLAGAPAVAQIGGAGPTPAPLAPVVNAGKRSDERTSSRVDEETLWNAARVTGCELPVSLTGCDAVRIYIAKYPKGSHVDEANRALAAGQPRLEALQKDENAWQQAGATACRAHAGDDACVGVELYVTKYPAGLHADEARTLVSATAPSRPSP